VDDESQTAVRRNAQALIRAHVALADGLAVSRRDLPHVRPILIALIAEVWHDRGIYESQSNLAEQLKQPAPGDRATRPARMPAGVAPVDLWDDETPVVGDSIETIPGIPRAKRRT
jgi:hypothetical protein